MIPEQGAQIIENPEYQERDPSHTFIPGVFSCPIVFRTTFDLYHRCAANPGQVAHKLEATVLHSFAVSNRQGIFVYKDEGGQIFYMSLQAKGSGLDDDGKVELLVHGIHKPGPSVTKQLRRLLQRRLLLIAVDMLSSVLTKNPHFNWKNADFEFLKSFEKDWLSVDEDKHVLSDQDCFYEFPVGVNDPCMVLVMFRQNLCGSTFFHRLIDVGYDGQSPPIIKSHSLDSGATVLKWNKHDFTLYYNNAPSNLDPSFQGVSTLTDKGAYYSRQAGTGIAMLEISLVRSNGEDVDELCFGEPATSGDNFIEAPLESLRFRKLTSLPDSDKNNSICLRVRVTDTALNREYLHEWIALTLNQALVGWETERLIERSSRGLIRPFQAEACEGAVSDEEELKEVAKDRLCPGLPALTSILESSRDLPHPAITKVLENNGVIRSSSVATTTLELLENCILTPIFADSNLKDPIAKARNHMCILRLTRFEKPKIVQLAWDALHRKAIVNITSSKSVEERTVDDSPIDCPEYICFFCLSQHDGQIDAIDPHLQLYQEVMLVDGSIQRSSSVELLQTIKKSNPTAFFRSFAFVFSVKRNRVSLFRVVYLSSRGKRSFESAFLVNYW